MRKETFNFMSAKLFSDSKYEVQPSEKHGVIIFPNKSEEQQIKNEAKILFDNEIDRDNYHIKEVVKRSKCIVVGRTASKSAAV